MNSFGRILKVSIYGESHGHEIGIIIDGCPAGIQLEESDFLADISRRSSGEIGTTSRTESDLPYIKSGVYRSYTNGAPILISFLNENIDSSEYKFSEFFRPGHADFTAFKKYRGYNDPNGGGHFSGRLTLPIVAAGVIAKKLISEIKISAELISVGGSKEIYTLVQNAVTENDSIGGVVECRIPNLPVGLGEPFFDSLESLISHAMFSIPGAKAIEFGEGIKSAASKGSEFNDVYINNSGQTATNNNGGINGGISNGNEIIFRVFFKPAASIALTQNTFNFNTQKIDTLQIRGRHDACYALRTPVIVEALAALVIADLKLISGI